jgi:ribose transport system permease protein
MKKLLGLAVFLAILYGADVQAVPPDSLGQNNYVLAQRIGLYGIISLGAALTIIIGGIDLSIGSVIALSATVLAILLADPSYGWPPALAIAVVLIMGAGIGFIHGLFITKMKLPAFMVTLCGLFIYRGVARTIAANQSKGLADQFADLRDFLHAEPVFGLPRFLIIFLVLAIAITVFLHCSVYGRYLFAIGSNERAVRYAGINADRYKTLAYVLCSMLAAFFGILFLMEHNSVRPSNDGNFTELYAIAGAVLGGCSLRGGEGTILGVIMGTSILVILPNLINMWGVSSELEFIIIGGALLLGAILDELLRSRGMARQAG